MERIQPKTFPPTLAVGSRVWTANGYPNHGPLDGPKVDIAAAQGGTVTAAQKMYLTMDNSLYTVEWDNGQASKHYYRELLCIGRFQDLKEFEQAIRPAGAATLTVGPKGGFRHVQLELEYDGLRQTVELYDRDLWQQYVERLVRSSGCEITKNRLPK